MTNTAQIKCINKDIRLDPHHRITHVGGFVTKQWKITTEDAIGKIERREWAFYTMVKNNRADVIVAVHNGRKYLKTVSDSDIPNNLLSLPECP